MKHVVAMATLMLMAGCAAAAPAASEAPAAAPSPAAMAPAPSALTLRCAGSFVQGGLALCRTLPGANITVDGQLRGAADAEGWAVIGFDRFAGAEAIVGASNPACDTAQSSCVVQTVTERIPIAPRAFSVQRVDGLPPQTVTPTEPEVLARIARERELKNAGFASRADVAGWLDGFVMPTDGRVSSSWGNQRILNGVPNTPHYGVDIAAPDGTPIRAPAAGVVALAEPDMHFEGGLVFIDHGQGLISMYLHMSRLDVRVGDRVAQGQLIGAVGHAGRATGPHLCWRLKWRDRNLDPSVAIQALSAARLEFGLAP